MKKLLLAIPVLIDREHILKDSVEKAVNQSLVKSGQADVLVIINNKNDHSILEQIEDYDVYAIENDANLGVAGSWNQSIIKATDPNDSYEYVANMGYDVLLNDDKFLEDFVAFMNSSNLEFCFTSGILFNFWAVKAAEFKIKIGLFDENFYPGYWEDLDMLVRMSIAEKYTDFTRGIFNQSGRVTHLQSKTINGHKDIFPHDVWNYSYTKNQMYMKQKWNIQDNKSFLDDINSLPKECFAFPFNNVKLHPSFWYPNIKEIEKSKVKWDECIANYNQSLTNE